MHLTESKSAASRLAQWLTLRTVTSATRVQSTVPARKLVCGHHVVHVGVFQLLYKVKQWNNKHTTFFVTVCEYPSFGVNCSETCYCAENALRCDPVRGCICGRGWAGSSCDEDIDECEDPHSCPFDKICVNTIGSFTCECYEGYSLNRENQCVGKFQISTIWIKRKYVCLPLAKRCLSTEHFHAPKYKITGVKCSKDVHV